LTQGVENDASIRPPNLSSVSHVTLTFDPLYASCDTTGIYSNMCMPGMIKIRRPVLEMSHCDILPPPVWPRRGANTTKYTSSAAVAERPHDASRLSVASFNSTLTTRRFKRFDVSTSDRGRNVKFLCNNFGCVRRI